MKIVKISYVDDIFINFSTFWTSFFAKIEKMKNRKIFFQKWQEINDNSAKIIGPGAGKHDFFRDAVVFDRHHMDFCNYGPKSHTT